MSATLESQQQEHGYRVKARKAVESRHFTDRPGGDWHLSEVGTPHYNGIYRTASIFPDPDGYDVYGYTYAGAEAAHKHFRGLDAAFRYGKKLANEVEES